MAGVVVRPVARGDYDEWRPLWDGYNAFYERQGPTALAEDITTMTWARFFDAYEPVHAMVAAESKRNAIPRVASIDAASSGLPTSRFASRNARRSKAPERGTPTWASLMRPRS